MNGEKKKTETLLDTNREAELERKCRENYDKVRIPAHVTA